ncbi:MAG: hypothetical protein HY363_06010 [Candidatus Aenigmarchaeota archaeon]|nr:hypothetical protein [Candidatus Aenigmarchaeota archaeon]
MSKFHKGEDTIINWFGYFKKKLYETKLDNEDCTVKEIRNEISDASVDILPFLKDSSAVLEIVEDLNFYAPHDSPGHGIFMDLLMTRHPELFREFISKKPAAKIKRLHDIITDIIVKPLYQLDVSNLRLCAETHSFLIRT